MKINPLVFKAYDIRGIYPQEIDEKVAYFLGRAFVEFTKVKLVVVGRDMRLSSDSLFKNLSQGIIESGAKVIDLGLCSSPVFNFAAQKCKTAGIIITASHNPKEYNGFKMVAQKGNPIGLDSGLKKIRELMEKEKFKKTEKGTIIESDMLEPYLTKVFGLTEKKFLSGFKIVVDCGNAMASLSIFEIFKKINSEIIPLYCKLDGNFPNHEANPVKEETLKDLKETVLKEKTDFGLAFDGDADRIGFVDEKGESISGDFITALVGSYLLREKPGEKILYTLISSKIIPEKIKKAGGIPVISRVGHTFIKEKMKKENILFGGELSGHFYFPDLYFNECPELVLFKIMELIRKEKKTLSELVKPLKKYEQSGELNFKVKDKEEVIRKLKKIYKDSEQSFLDGLTCEYKDWWFNVRLSNTEPVVRLNIEADNKKLLEEKKEELIKVIIR